MMSRLIAVFGMRLPGLPGHRCLPRKGSGGRWAGPHWWGPSWGSQSGCCRFREGSLSCNHLPLSPSAAARVAKVRAEKESMLSRLIKLPAPKGDGERGGQPLRWHGIEYG